LTALPRGDLLRYVKRDWMTPEKIGKRRARPHGDTRGDESSVPFLKTARRCPIITRSGECIS
jgi:hypothetical protein